MATNWQKFTFMKISSFYTSFYQFLTRLLFFSVAITQVSNEALSASDQESIHEKEKIESKQGSGSSELGSGSDSALSESKSDTLSTEPESMEVESEKNAGKENRDKSDPAKETGESDPQQVGAGKDSQAHENHRPARKEVVQIKPGQKLKIAGFAEKKEPVIVDADLATADLPVYHQANLKMTGSLCYACLLELQDKLKQIYGIERAKIEKNEQVSLQSTSALLPNYADAQIIYDASKLDFLDLKVYIRANGYFPYKVVQKSISSLPAEGHSKKH